MIGLSVAIQIFAGRVLNSIPEGLLIALLAWMLLRVVGRQNSGTRFAVWFAALLAIAVLPFIPAAHVGGSMARAVHAEVTLPGTWAVGLVCFWAIVSVFGGFRLLYGVLRVRGLRRNSSVKQLVELEPTLRQTLEECQAVRPVELRTSSSIRVPSAVGFFHPVILIPDWAFGELSAEELRAIVLHEFAHLRRWDDWTNLIQKIVRAVFFFHPAVLWIEKRLSLEREMACDDAVLAETESPHAYARCLISVAEKSFVRRSVALAQAAISRAPDTSLRIAQILDLDRPKATRVFKPALVAVGGMMMVSFLVLPDAPRLIAFQPPSPTASNFGAGAPRLASLEQYPDLPKSMIVPAVARLDGSQGATLKVKEVKRADVPVVDSANRVLVKHKQAPRGPLVVQAKLRKPVPEEQFLVFTQTTDYYRQGSAIVGISVWRVTLVTTKALGQVQAPKQT
jgi:beta-lactamase regulating signal transducer with metallopeptidase domain